MKPSANMSITHELPAPVSVIGVPVHPWTMRQTVNAIEQAIDEGGFTQHVVVNAAKMANLSIDPALRQAVTVCDIINADGMGVVWAARLLGKPLPERVAGIDLFEQLLGLAEARQWPVYLLGATEPSNEACAAEVARRFPALPIAGRHHGYFWDEEDAQVHRIRASGAKLLFVAITSPKKEQFIDRWQAELGVNFAMGVGGTFDVWAGKVRRAPHWMQTNGLEWAWRAGQEPRRMLRRSLVTNARFLGLVARHWRQGGE